MFSVLDSTSGQVMIESHRNSVEQENTVTASRRPWGGLGWVESGLKSDFNPLMVISPTASWVRWCMQVYAGVSVVS